MSHATPSPSTGQLVTASRNEERPASSQIAGWCWVGIVLQVVGGIAAGASWPHTSVTPDPLGGGPFVDSSGSMLGVFLGVALAQAGFLLLLVAVIAQGVKLGTRAASEQHATPRPVPVAALPAGAGTHSAVPQPGADTSDQPDPQV